MVPYAGRREVYESAIDTYGTECQIWKAVEEMSELTKELAKRQCCNADNLDAMVDEIADVTIMMEQLRLMFGVNKAVQERMDYKIRRLARRVGIAFIPEVQVQEE